MLMNDPDVTVGLRFRVCVCGGFVLACVFTYLPAVLCSQLSLPRLVLTSVTAFVINLLLHVSNFITFFSMVAPVVVLLSLLRSSYITFFIRTTIRKVQRVAAPAAVNDLIFLKLFWQVACLFSFVFFLLKFAPNQ